MQSLKCSLSLLVVLIGLSQMCLAMPGLRVKRQGDLLTLEEVELDDKTSDLNPLNTEVNECMERVVVVWWHNQHKRNKLCFVVLYLLHGPKVQSKLWALQLFAKFMSIYFFSFSCKFAIVQQAGSVLMLKMLVCYFIAKLHLLS